MARKHETDSLTLYEQALAAAACEIVGAFRDAVDPPAGKRAARDVTAWLGGLYGRDAIRDLAEHLAAEIATSTHRESRPPQEPRDRYDDIRIPQPRA